MARIAVNRSRRLSTLTAIAVALACVAVAVNVHYARLAAEQPQGRSPLAVLRVAAPEPKLDTPTVPSLKQHLQRYPRDRAARYRLAHLHFQSNNYARALEELAVLERENPRDSEVHLRKAVVLKYDQQPVAAEREIRRALALQPGYDLAEALLGEIHLDQHRYRDALKVFERQLKKRPESLSSLMGKGRALEQLSLAQNPVEVTEMLAPVEKAAELAPTDAQVLVTLARMKLAYLHTKKGLAGAEQAALRAAQLNPQDAQPYTILAQIHLARSPTPENLQKVGYYAAQAGALDLKDPRPPYLIGRVALLQNDAPRAARALELAVRLGPLPETVTQLAVAHRRAGNPERAEHYARIYQRYSRLVGRRDVLLAAREREPKELRHYHELAKLYLEAGQPDTAEQWLEQARSVRPRDATRDALIAQAKAFRNKGHDAPLLPVP